MADAGLLGGLSGLKLGSGFVTGLVTGYISKKVSKIVAVMTGLFLVVLQVMESRGFITVHWSKLTAGMIDAGGSAAAQAPSLLSTIVSTLGLGAAFSGGFFIGFKKG